MSERLPVLYQNKPCYDIYYTRGFEELATELEALNLTGHKICVITDSKVNAIYTEPLLQVLKNCCKETGVYVFEEGESHKNLDTIRDAYRYLIERHFDRKDLLVALGGGVTGDMCGFIAATYLRGIDFIQIPTTLLAQADSSIGGKTGVDFEGYKNMVGAFKMPRLVYMNLEVLSTLDDRQYFAGFAEIMKHGLIKDSIFYEWLIENMYEICERDLDVCQEMLIRSNSVKKRVVEKDPLEQGDRALLNYGHTIGHAIEKAMDFKLLHGECVALGCVAAAYISWKKELLTMEEYYEIRDMFVPFNLPISMDDIDAETILQITKSDKKSENGTCRFVLLKKIGKAIIRTDVTDQEILDAVNELIFKEED